MRNPTPDQYPQVLTSYYLARCGSLYQVTRTQPHASSPVRVMQARRSLSTGTWGQPYPTTAEEVSQAMRSGAFTPTPAPPAEVPTPEPCL